MLRALLPTLALTLSAIAGQSPPKPDAIVDLRDDSAAASVGARWRYADASIVETSHRAAGADLKPSGPEVRTHNLTPQVGTPDFERAAWSDVAPRDLEARRTNGRLAFGWYRLNLTLPESITGVSTTGATAVLEVTIDDYAEVWVDGRLVQTLGDRTITGWNAPTRVTLSRDAKPGQAFDVAIFAANGPLSRPPTNYVWVRSATLDLYSPGREASPVDTRLTRDDPAFDAIFPPGTQAERLAEGFVFTEGPVWVPGLDPGQTYGGGGQGGYLLFSDPNQNIIHRYDPTENAVTIFRTKSGYTGLGGAPIGEYFQPGSNGLALDPQGRLTICEHGNRRVTRLEPNGSLVVLADRFEGQRLNSPNDLVYRSDGTLYFTDPPFGLPKAFGDPRKELALSGVFRVKDGVVSLAAKDLAAPNGLAFSPDEKTLYVDNWEENRKIVLRYDVAHDGTLVNPTVFADLTSTTGEICLDGLKVDRAGNVLVAGPGGIWVFSPPGKLLGTLSLPELPANFAFGDADGRSLYITARTGLYRVRVGANSGARLDR